MALDDGGSAFPEIMTDVRDTHGNSQSDTYSFGGMSLRDYFAAKAMQAIIGTAAAPCFHLGKIDVEPAAESAYLMADAMLAARKS